MIEEQLPFPSGTATAQLINVLHRLPPPDTTIRRRHGYRELDAEEENEEVENVRATSPHAPGHDEERVMVEQDGWHTLIWSFNFAALVSVSTPCIPWRIRLIMTSLQPTSSQSCSPYRFSGVTWRNNGSGTSPRVCHTSVKASLLSSNI